MGEKGLKDAITSLSPGYHLDEHNPGSASYRDAAGRPGPERIRWDDAHGAWSPPGFESDPSDPQRLFNPTTGQNAIWDDAKGGWIDTSTGQSVSR
jgi:hypothetical protein